MSLTLFFRKSAGPGFDVLVLIWSYKYTHSLGIRSIPTTTESHAREMIEEIEEDFHESWDMEDDQLFKNPFENIPNPFATKNSTLEQGYYGNFH